MSNPRTGDLMQLSRNELFWCVAAAVGVVLIWNVFVVGMYRYLTP